ncbi:MAG: ThuA domain-containing protein [Prevotellaceae bacterium]|jgi:type 1 glutamine amidotransferase|nr:ThuA domain-containing protein [Prevotellaceae bacterium]
MKTVKKIFVLFLIFLISSDILNAKDPIKVLVLTGQNNHNWQASSVILQKYLNESGIFAADLAVSPKTGEDMSSFCPDFSAYKAVVLDYTGDSWSEKTNKAFLEYVNGGGGVVVYHAANNAFRNWKEYNEITGLGGWDNRNETDGPYVYFRDGNEVRDTTPGPGGSHGKKHEYKIALRIKDHPITKGLPEIWTHSKDELYDRLRGPAKNLTVLATAWSDKETGGTGRDEPVLMVIKWGKGRVFHTILGHVGAGDGPYPAVEGASFIVTFLRGTEWAATGKVSQGVPDDFPCK